MKKFLILLAILLPLSALAINITVPQSTMFGDFLRGNANGTYSPVATSTLGIIDRGWNAIFGNSTSTNSTTTSWFYTNKFRVGSEAHFEDFLELHGTSTPATPAANHLRLYSTVTQGHTRPTVMDDDGCEYVINRDLVRVMRNTSGGPITKGQAVYVTGSTGNVPNVGLAKADSLTTLPAVGVAACGTIADNAFGNIMLSGNLSMFDTSAFSTGDRLYVSPTVAGALVNSRPVYPYFAQRMGTVLVSGVGNGSVDVTTAPFIGGEESGTNALLWTGNNLLVSGATSTSLAITSIPNVWLTTNGQGSVIPSAFTPYSATNPSGYQTEAQVNAYIHGSTTIPKTYTNNTFGGTQSFGNLVANNLVAAYLTVSSLVNNGFAIGTTTPGLDSFFQFLTDGGTGTMTYSNAGQALSFDKAFTATNLSGTNTGDNTFGDGLTLTGSDVDCDTASGTTFGCLSAANWTTFNNKLSAEVDGSTSNEIQDLSKTGDTLSLSSDASTVSLAEYYNSLTDLQGAVTNDFHNLGGVDANTTYTGGDFLTLTATDFDVDVAAVTNGDITHLSTADAIYDWGVAAFQPLEATLTDIADGTIAENLVNTTNPWATNEIDSSVIISSEIDTSSELAGILTDEDGSGDCGANVFCLGGHTHSGYLLLTGGTVTGATTINDNNAAASTLLTIGDANDLDSLIVYGNVGVEGNIYDVSQTSLTVNDNIYAAGGSHYVTTGDQYNKYCMYGDADSTYCIGMKSGNTFGPLNDWAMVFGFNAEADRGWLFRDTTDAVSDGAMALTTTGVMQIKGNLITGSTLTTETTVWNHFGSGTKGETVVADANDVFITDDLEVDGQILVDTTAASGDTIGISGISRVSSTAAGGIAVRGIAYADADSGGVGVSGYSSGGAVRAGIYGCDDGVGANCPTLGSGIYAGYFEGAVKVVDGLTVATIDTGNGAKEVNSIAAYTGDQNLGTGNSPTFVGLTLTGTLNIGNGTYMQEGGTNFADVDYGGGNATFRFLRSVDVVSGSSYLYNGGCVAGSCSSDKRLKANITPITKASAKLSQLTPATFTYKDKKYGPTDEESYGLIAQEVEKVFPEWVTTDKDGIKHITYTQNLTMTMLAALIEQQAEIDRLKTVQGQNYNWLGKLVMKLITK